MFFLLNKSFLTNTKKIQALKFIFKRFISIKTYNKILNYEVYSTQITHSNINYTKLITIIALNFRQSYWDYSIVWGELVRFKIRIRLIWCSDFLIWLCHSSKYQLLRYAWIVIGHTYRFLLCQHVCYILI